jgi:hypothetical protein
LWKFQIKMCAVNLNERYISDKVCPVVRGRVPMPLELFHAVWYSRSANQKEFRMHVMPPAKRSRGKRVTLRWSWNLTFDENDVQWKKFFPDLFKELKGPRQIVLGRMTPTTNVSFIYDVIKEELGYFFRYQVTRVTN